MVKNALMMMVAGGSRFYLKIGTGIFVSLLKIKLKYIIRVSISIRVHVKV